MMKKMQIHLLCRWKAQLSVLLPAVLLSPLLWVPNSKESKCAYGLLLMLFYWTTECLPLPVTAFLPTIIFPLAEISKPEAVASHYIKGLSFVLIGGLAVAIAIEEWNIHKRIALRFLMIFGTSSHWLLLGLMLTTGFISMWICNTATVSMMLPIGNAILQQLVTKGDKSEDSLTQKTVDADKKDNDIKIGSGLNSQEQTANKLDINSIENESQKLCKAAILAITYAANIGGISTLTGTSPNLAVKGFLDQLSGGTSGVNYTSWFLFCVPVAFTCLILTWLCIVHMFFGIRTLRTVEESKRSTAAMRMLQIEYQKLGPISFAEKAVIGHFVLMVLLWFFRDPEIFPGWSLWFKKGYTNDAIPAILISCSLFVFPSCSKKSHVLLEWKQFSAKFPWGVMMMVGGGLALAAAIVDSGFSLTIASSLKSLANAPPWCILAVVTIAASLCTEFMSNTAVCVIFMPILSELSKAANLHPVYLLLPASIAASFAFILPISTPPNTIAFTYGYLQAADMAKVGFLVNFICVIILLAAMITWGVSFFNLYAVPHWNQTV